MNQCGFLLALGIVLSDLTDRNLYIKNILIFMFTIRFLVLYKLFSLKIIQIGQIVLDTFNFADSSFKRS